MCAVTCAKCCCQNNSKFVLNCRLSTEGEDSKESKMDYSQEVSFNVAVLLNHKSKKFQLSLNKIMNIEYNKQQLVRHHDTIHRLDGLIIVSSDFVITL